MTNFDDNFKIAELQRRVADLSTMNEMLLEQNAQYRQNNRNQSTTATPIQQMPVTQHIPQQVKNILLQKRVRK